MHCVWYWIRCTAQLYYSHASASVIATRWILTNFRRCDGINLCCGVVRSEPRGVDQYSSYCSVFQASSSESGLQVSNTSRSLLVELSYFITWNLTVYNLTEETVYCFCGNKTVHDCCCFELFYRLELDFLQVSWFVGKERNNLFLIPYVATVVMILSALLIHDWYWNSIRDKYDFL